MRVPLVHDVARPAGAMRRLRPLGLALSLALAYPLAPALPQGAQVVQGQVTVSPGLIQQGSDKAIVNWQSFSIAAGETLRVQQPGVNAVLLNRVVGGDPSLLLGQLQANGRVFLVNPRGIVFGRGSQVDAGGLVASTLDLSDNDFLAGVYRFSAGTQAGALRAEGRISAPGGTVALVAPELSVSGSIDARRVGLAAGSTVQVDVEGDGLVLFNLRNDDGRDVALQFNGQVRAEGNAELRAQARAGAAGQVLNMDGLVQARGLRQAGGRILIDGGTAGDTLVRGRLDASGDTGGQVTVLGQRVGLLDAAQVDVSGVRGGGEVQIGGGVHGEGTTHNAERTYVGAAVEIRADATGQGDGGRVAIWADRRTDMLGRIGARGGPLGGNGGFVETSGRETLHMPRGGVDVSAARGRAGQWLLDPYNLTIQDSGGTGGNVPATQPFESAVDDSVLDLGVLNTALAGGGTVTVQTGSGGGQAGDITVNGDIQASGASGLNLLAANAITFTGAGKIRSTAGALNVQLQAGTSVDTSAGTIDTHGGRLVVSAGAAVTLGAVSLDGATRGDLSVTTTGPVTLGSVQGGLLTVQSGGGPVRLPTGHVSGAVNITTAGGDVTQAAGTLTAADAVTIDAGAGAVTLGHLQSTLGLGITTTSGGVSLDGTEVGGLFRFTSTTGSLGQAGAIRLAGGAQVNTGGSVLLTHVDNSLQGTLDLAAGTVDLRQAGSTPLVLGALSTGALKARTGSGALTLGQGSVASLDVASTTGSILQAGSGLTVSGSATLATGGSGQITLGTLATGTLLSVTTVQGHVSLGRSTVGGSLVVRSTSGSLAQTAELAVTGTSDLQVGGAVSLPHSNNAWGGGVQVNASSLDLAARGNLTLQGLTLGANQPLSLQAQGNLNLGASVNLNTGSADLTLASGGDFTVLGTLAGKDIALSAGHNLILAQDITASGSLQLTAATANPGGVTQTGGRLSVGTTTAVSAGSGVIDLNRPANHFVGAVSLHGGSTTLQGNGALVLGMSSVDSLQATAAGPITQAGRLVVAGTTTLDAGTASITLADRTNDLGGDITVAGAGVSLATSQDLHLVSLTQRLSNQALELDAGRRLYLPSGTTSINTGSAPLTLSSRGDAFATFDTLEGGNVTLRGSSVRLGHDVTAHGTLQVESTAGVIEQTAGHLVAMGASNFAAGSQAITLDRPGNDLRGAVSLSGSTVTVLAPGALRLGAVQVTADLDVQAGGPITQTGNGVSVQGMASFGAGNAAITLNESTNSWGTAVDLRGGVTQLTGQGGIRLGSVAVSALTLQAGGPVSQSQPLTLGGALRVDAGTATITLDDGANALNGAVSLVGGTTRVHTQGALSLDQVTVSGDFTASSRGLLRQSAGTWQVSGNASFDAGNAAITITNTANTWGGPVSLHGGTTQLGGGSITLGTVDVGSLDVTALGPVGQLTRLRVGGALGVNAGSAVIDLLDSGNQIGGTVTLTGGTTRVANQTGLTLGNLATGDLTVQVSGPLNLGAGRVSGDLRADSGHGAISQTGGLRVTGSATFVSGSGDIMLPSTGNEFLGALSLTGNAVTVFNRPSLSFGTLSFNSLDATSDGAISLGSGMLTGGLTARARGGSITQVAGGLTVQGDTTLQASSGISLPEANHFNGIVNLRGGNSTLTNAGNLRLGTLQVGGLTLSVSGTLNLGSGSVGSGLSATTSGAISQAGNLSVGGDANLNAGVAGISLGQGGNAFAGTVDLRGGDTVIAAGGSLSLGSLNVASLTATAGGTLRLGAGTVGGDLGARAGSITQAGGGLSVGGSSTLTAGSVDLGEPGNAFGGLVSLSAGDVTLTASGALRLGSVSTRDLRLTAGGDLDLGRGSVSGDLSATTRGRRITQAGTLVVRGKAGFVADGSLVDLVLDDAANQLLGPIEMRGINGGSFVSASFASALDLSFTGDVQTLTLSSGGRLTLGGGRNQTLTAAARNGIVQTGALTVSGETTLIARGGAGMAVDLGQAGNDFRTVTLAADNGGSLGRVQLREGDASRRDGLRVAGDAATLEISAAGALTLGGGRYTRLVADTTAGQAAITQDAALEVSGDAALQAGAGEITLARADNRLPRLTIGSAGVARIVSQGDYTVGASQVSTRLALGGPGTITLDGPLSGSGELRMEGSGSLVLAGPHGYTGGTRLDSGRLVLQGSAAVPGTGPVQLGASAQLDLRDGAVLASGLTVLGGRITGSSGAGTLAGPVVLLASATFEPGAGGLAVGGVIDDGGAGFGVRLAGSGALTLAGVNRYAGATAVDSGLLRAATAGALPSASAVSVAAGASLVLGADQAIGSLAGAGRVELGSATLATGADGRDSVFAGSLAGTGGLTKRGAGRFTLGGSATFTGATRVEAGELVLASTQALGDATAVSIDAGATLTVQQSVRLGSLAGAGTADVQADELAVGANGGSTRWAGALTGRGAVVKLGAGTLTLAGSNRFTGGLRVQAGILQLEGAGVRPQAAQAAQATSGAGAAAGPVLPAATAVSVAGGATLALLTDVAVDTLSGAGQVQLGASTLTLGAAGGSSRFDGAFSGSGSLVKAGAGTLALGGRSSHAGTTRVAEGELVLDAERALGEAVSLVIDAPGQVQVNAAQTVAALGGAGRLVLNGASFATGGDGRDGRFDGALSGSGSLVKQGAGTLTLTAASTHGGGTRIEAGALLLSGQGSLGSGAVHNDGQLVLARSEALTLDQAVSGRGSLVVQQGQVTLAHGGNSYSGATVVQGGRLVTTAPDRLPDASAVQVAAGAELQLGGSETVASLQAAGSVRLAGNFTTAGEQVYTGRLTLANPAGLTLAGSLIDASRSSNEFGSAPLGLQGGQALVTASGTLVLGDVALSQGGRIEAARLGLEGRLQLTGGALTLAATATPDEAKATRLGSAQVPVAGQPLAVAEATVQQGSASAITVAEAARLQVEASGGGSVQLGRDANHFQGTLAVLSGAAYDTAWSPNVQGAQAVQSLVSVAGQQVRVGGRGIEADLVTLRADQLATDPGAALVARLPYDEIVLGRALSAPGLTLELAPGAFGVPGSFGAINGQAIQVAVGSTETGARTAGPNAGWVSVLPKGGAQGATAVVLAGPKVGSVPAGGGPAYRFFHDGAARPTEIPVVYNGVLPLTPAASGALSSINGDAEEARRARFQETVRTENVTVRLRAGVIAEVGPGRASTQGSEGARPPELCDPADRPVLSCKPSATP